MQLYIKEKSIKPIKLNNMNITDLKEISALKTKAVQSQNYALAKSLRDAEEELLKSLLNKVEDKELVEFIKDKIK